MKLAGIGFPLVLSLFFAAHAFAAYPLDTDDAGTQGKGKFQIEVNGQTVLDEDADAVGSRTAARRPAPIKTRTDTRRTPWPGPFIRLTIISMPASA